WHVIASPQSQEQQLSAATYEAYTAEHRRHAQPVPSRTGPSSASEATVAPSVGTGREVGVADARQQRRERSSPRDRQGRDPLDVEHAGRAHDERARERLRERLDGTLTSALPERDSEDHDVVLSGVLTLV